MCVTFIYLTPLDDKEFPYKLIILNNRDEEFDRPTSGLAWENDILAGRDEKSADRGTWLGISRTGRIGNLLSITQPWNEKSAHAPSRGRIIKTYLEGNSSPEDYCSRLVEGASKFNGFQFVCLDRNPSGHYELWTLTNMLVDTVEPISWSPGVHGIGNSPRDKPFKKVTHGEVLFEKIVEEAMAHKDEQKLIQELIGLANDQTKCYPDEQLGMQIGDSVKNYQYLSSILVRLPPKTVRYGTRCHSIILINQQDEVTFLQKSMINAPENIDDAKWETKIEKFRI